MTMSQHPENIAPVPRLSFGERLGLFVKCAALMVLPCETLSADDRRDAGVETDPSIEVVFDPHRHPAPQTRLW